MNLEELGELNAINKEMTYISRTALRAGYGGQVIGQLEELLERYRKVIAKEPNRAWPWLMCELLSNLRCAYEQEDTLKRRRGPI